MEGPQRLLAERFINEVMYQGQRGYLSEGIMDRLTNVRTNVYSATTTQTERKNDLSRSANNTNEEEVMNNNNNKLLAQ